MKNKRRLIIIVVLFIILIVGIILFLIKPNSKEINAFVSKKVELNFKDRKNDSLNYSYDDDHLTVGWLQVQGTNIDYPIFNIGDEYPDALGGAFGWRSSCYQSGDNVESIGGHNVINVSSNPVRDMDTLTNFEALLVFTYEDFAKDNLYISYTKNGETNIYKIFAAGFNYRFIENECSIPYKNKDNIEEFIKNAKNNSIYDYNVDVNSDDEIISLNTCTRYFGKDGKDLFIINARKLRKDEEIKTYEVSTNDNYKELAKGVGKEVE